MVWQRRRIRSIAHAGTPSSVRSEPEGVGAAILPAKAALLFLGVVLGVGCEDFLGAPREDGSPSLDAFAISFSGAVGSFAGNTCSRNVRSFL